MIKRGVIIVSLLLALVVVAAFMSYEDSGPAYKGHSLREWVESYRRANQVEGSREQAEWQAAIRYYDTNAIPYLLNWIQYEPPVWRTWLLKAENIVRLKRGLAQSREIDRFRALADDAVPSLRALGDAANGAIPELVKIARIGHTPTQRERAASALFQIRPLGFLSMICTLTNKPPINLEEIRWSLHTSWNGNIELAIPVLLGWLKDADERVVVAGIRGIGCIPTKMRTSNTVDALLGCLKDQRPDVRKEALFPVFSHFRDDIKIITALLAMKNDPDVQIREQATEIRGSMRSLLNMEIGEKLVLVTNSNPSVRLQASKSLGRLQRIMQALTNAPP